MATDRIEVLNNRIEKLLHANNQLREELRHISDFADSSEYTADQIVTINDIERFVNRSHTVGRDMYHAGYRRVNLETLENWRDCLLKSGYEIEAHQIQALIDGGLMK